MLLSTLDFKQPGILNELQAGPRTLCGSGDHQGGCFVSSSTHKLATIENEVRVGVRRLGWYLIYDTLKRLEGKIGGEREWKVLAPGTEFGRLAWQISRLSSFLIFCLPSD